MHLEAARQDPDLSTRSNSWLDTTGFPLYESDGRLASPHVYALRPKPHRTRPLVIPMRFWRASVTKFGEWIKACPSSPFTR
jgi:hypothetical protein